MPTKEKTKEKEFGFIITQGISRKMTKAKVTEKLTGFLAKRKQDLMKTLKLQENRIHTSSYYDRNSREYKGLLRIKKEFSDSRNSRILDKIIDENRPVHHRGQKGRKLHGA